MAPKKQLSSAKKGSKRKRDAQLVESQKKCFTHSLLVQVMLMAMKSKLNLKGTNLIMVNMNPIMSA
jgi:hypothetical protein